MKFREKIEKIYKRIFAGELLEAFEENYHDDVVMIEPSGDRREGKDVNREAEKKFLDSVQEWHGGGVNNIGSDEDNGVTFVESWMEVTFKGADNKMKTQQIARQKWKDDQIIEERFYYNIPDGR